MAILLTFLTNLTLTSFISCFIFKSDIKNESINDMIINKKMYNERVARQVFIIFISNTNNLVTSSADSKSSLYFGSATNREKTI